MNTKKSLATFWLIVLVTTLKIFSIIFLCSLNISLHSMLMRKYAQIGQSSPILFEVIHKT